MSAPTPFFSIIVACKNPGLRLHEALDSVWRQRNVTFELIVIDGASRDGSCEWLEAQRSRISSLISATDEGVYDAMNRGVSLARGHWVFFLGADDKLTNESVLVEAHATLEKRGNGVGVGEAAYDDGRIYRLSSSANPLARNFIHHQASFYHRSLFAAHGSFDLSFPVMADYDLNVRLLKAGVSFVPLPIRIAECCSGGLSDAGRWQGYAEEIRVRHRHFPAWRCWCWDVLSIVRWGRKIVIRSVERNHG